MKKLFLFCCVLSLICPLTDVGQEEVKGCTIGVASGKATADGRPLLWKNADGSYDVYFSPEAPAGKESNWIQTVPGKGWNMLFRLYGPLEPWFDKTWRPGDPEVIE